LPPRGEPLPPRGELLPSRGEPLPSRGEPLPSRGESLPFRGEPLPSRGEPFPSRGESLPSRGEPLPSGRRSSPAVPWKSPISRPPRPWNALPLAPLRRLPPSPNPPDEMDRLLEPHLGERAGDEDALPQLFELLRGGEGLHLPAGLGRQGSEALLQQPEEEEPHPLDLTRMPPLLQAFPPRLVPPLEPLVVPR